MRSRKVRLTRQWGNRFAMSITLITCERVGRGALGSQKRKEHTSAQDLYLHLILLSLCPILEQEHAPRLRHQDTSRRGRYNGSGVGEP